MSKPDQLLAIKPPTELRFRGKNLFGFDFFFFYSFQFVFSFDLHWSNHHVTCLFNIINVRFKMWQLTLIFILGYSFYVKKYSDVWHYHEIRTAHLLILRPAAGRALFISSMTWLC